LLIPKDFLAGALESVQARLQSRAGVSAIKVAIDASPLAEPVGGISRYTTQFHRALSQVFPEDEFFLQQPGHRLWWSCGLPAALKRRRVTLFHGTDFAVPYIPVCASVMTIHDLSPWRPPFESETSPRVRRRAPWLLRMGLATMVVTPSEAVRREVIEHFRLRPETVAAVHLAAGSEFHPVNVPRGGYFLFVGTNGARKNLDVILAARRELGVDLWLAGRGHDIREPGVRLLGAVGDEELPALFSGAEALLLPSLYEGFGLPAIEAMRCGVPVIASRDPALLEVCGGAALHADASGPRAWADAMRAVQSNRQEWAARGIVHAAQFTWENSARKMHAVYEEAICRHAL
jgi:glycosyltransferase involved in cell wall biosynthesis